MVSDKDGTQANTIFSVSVEGGCPLEATEALYGGVSGQSYTVNLQLTSQLDYETQHTYDCTIRATVSHESSGPGASVVVMTR